MKILEKNNIGAFRFDVLSEQEMGAVVGGKRHRPKSRDKDHFDEEDE